MRLCSKAASIASKMTWLFILLLWSILLFHLSRLMPGALRRSLFRAVYVFEFVRYVSVVGPVAVCILDL